MIEDLVNTYIKKADAWNRIFSKMKIRSILFCCSPLVIFLYPRLLKLCDIKIWPYIAQLIIMLPCIVLFFIFHQGAKKILGIKNNSLLWNSPKNKKIINDYEINIVEGYLKKNNIYQIKHIKSITEKLKTVLEKRKINIGGPLSLSVLLLPIWEEWVSFIFAHHRETGEFISFIESLCLSMLFALMLIVLFLLVKKTIKDLYDLVFDRRSENIRSLISVLEDIKFSLELKE